MTWQMVLPVAKRGFSSQGPIASLPSMLLGVPKSATIYEVGPRDGLQNEPADIPTQVKVELINKLAESGLKAIEATSFVSPKWVPKMADAAKVMASIARKPGVRYGVLTPNMKGLEGAVKAGASEVSVFAAASEAFSKKNINCSIDESLKRFEEVMAAAKQQNMPVRGYVSCVVGCPYSGPVDPKRAASVAQALRHMGCYQVSMGDTTGVGTPATVGKMFEETMKLVPAAELASHMHDTYGQAVANILIGLQLGVTTIDSSVAGLGGCPYAKGATGNVATEDVVYMLDGLGIEHGVNKDMLLDAHQLIMKAIGRPSASKAAQAMLAARASESK